MSQEQTNHDAVGNDDQNTSLCALRFEFRGYLSAARPDFAGCLASLKAVIEAGGPSVRTRQKLSRSGKRKGSPVLCANARFDRPLILGHAEKLRGLLATPLWGNDRPHAMACRPFDQRPAPEDLVSASRREDHLLLFKFEVCRLADVALCLAVSS